MGEETKTYTQLSDEELIERINSDDRHAYAVLLQRYSHKIVRMAMSVLKNEDEAHDVAQDVFMSLLVALEKWDGDGQAKFSSWIYRVTFNKAVDYKRKRKPVENMEDVHLPSKEKDGYQQVLEKQMSEKLRSLLRKLPDTQRQAIFLYYYKEMTIPDIARTMKSTEVAVRSLLKRGKAILRDKIKYEDSLNKESQKELV